MKKRGNKKIRILHFRVYPKDKAENAEWGQMEREGKTGGTLLSIPFSIVLTSGTMLMFYKLQFLIKSTGWDGGKIPLNWK